MVSLLRHADTRRNEPIEKTRGHFSKTRRVGPVDNRPFTNFLNHFVKKTQKKHVTGDRWHIICDT